MLSFAEKITIILQRRNMTQGDLAALLGTTRNNISNKLKRNNFSERDMVKYTEALGCTYSIQITMNDTNEVL